MSAIINALSNAANGSVPGDQSQPVDEDWATRVGRMARRVLFSAGQFALQVDPDKPNMYNEGFPTPDTDPRPPNERPSQPYHLGYEPPVSAADREASVRKTFDMPKGEDFESRFPEEVGPLLAGVPFSGGPVGQAINAGMSIGVPEGLQGLKSFFGTANAAEPDPNATPAAYTGPKPAPYVGEKPAGDVPAPYAPRLDGTDALPDGSTGSLGDYTGPKPSDWLGSVMNDKTYWVTAGGIAATALGVLGVMRYNSGSAAALATRMSELTGNTAAPRISSIMSAFNGGILDRNGPLKDAFAVMNPRNSELFGPTVDTTLNSAPVSQKIGEWQTSGVFPRSGVKGEPIADVYTSVAKQIKDVDPAINTLEQRLGWEQTTSGEKQFDNYLRLKSELDIRRAADAKWTQQQYAATGVMPASRVGTASEIRPNLWDKSTDEIEQFVRAGDANPVFAGIQARFKDQLLNVGEHLMRKGDISPQDLAEWRGAYPNYVPNLQREGDGAWAWLKDKMLPKFDAQNWQDQTSFLERSLEQHGGISGNGTDKTISALDAIDHYTQQMLKFSEVNGTRRWFLGQAMSSQYGKAGPKDFKLTDPRDPNAIMYKDAGKDVYVQVNDPAVRYSLQANPIMTSGIMNATRGIMQQGTTGIAAPWFAINNLYHMGQRGAIARNTGTNFGGIETLADTLGSKYTGPMLDPTAPYTAAIDGVTRNVYGNLLKGFSTGLRQSINDDGLLAKVFEKAAPMFGSSAQQVSDAMSDAYLRTSLHILSSEGVGHGGALGTLGEGDAISSLGMNAPAYAGNPLYARSFFNFYDKLVSSVRNGIETHYFAANNRADATDAQKVINAGLTRDLGGDLGRHGSYGPINAYTAVEPYGNPILQGGMRLARAFRDNPVSFITGVISTYGVPAAITASLLANLSPDERDQYYKLTPEDRVSHMHIPWPGVDSANWYKHPVAPEGRPIWAAIMTLVDHIYGFSSHVIDHQNNRDIKSSLGQMIENIHASDLTSGALSALYAGVPPLMTAGLAAMGVNVPDSLGGPAKSISGQRLDNFDKSPTQYPDDALTSVHQKVFTALFGQAAQIAVQTARAYHYAAKGTDSIWEGVKEGAGEFGAELARRVPEVNGLLWSVPQRLTTHNADNDMLSSKLDTLKQLERVEDVQIGQGGATTPSGQPLLFNKGGVQDADLGKVLLETKNFNKTVLRDITQKRSDFYSQRDAINGAPALTAPQKLDMSNGYTKSIEEINRAGIDAIHQFENQMTALHPLLAQRMGGRITLEKLVGMR